MKGRQRGTRATSESAANSKPELNRREMQEQSHTSMSSSDTAFSGLRMKSHTRMAASPSRPANIPSNVNCLPCNLGLLSATFSENTETPCATAPANAKFIEQARDMPASRWTSGNTSDEYRNGMTYVHKLNPPLRSRPDLWKTYTRSGTVQYRVYEERADGPRITSV